MFDLRVPLSITKFLNTFVIYVEKESFLNYKMLKTKIISYNRKVLKTTDLRVFARYKTKFTKLK